MGRVVIRFFVSAEFLFSVQGGTRGGNRKFGNCNVVIVEEFVFSAFDSKLADRLAAVLFPIICCFSCRAARILLLPPHGMLETCSRSRPIEEFDDKESSTLDWLVSVRGRKSPSPEHKQLQLFFSTYEPHHLKGRERGRKKNRKKRSKEERRKPGEEEKGNSKKKVKKRKRRRKKSKKN